MRKSVRSFTLLSVAALVAAGLTSAGGSAVASTARAAEPEVLAKHLMGPLSAGVAKDGSVYVSQNFGGSLVHVIPGEEPAVVYQSKEKNAEVGGASVYKKTVTFTITGKNKMVKQIHNGGKATNLADVGKWEATKNPDKGVTYGLQGATPECEAQWPVKEAGPPSYDGIVDSHPYSTYTTAEGVYVGDAAGNDILWIGNNGKIKTVALLPPTPVTITAEAATALKLPDCVVGLDYWFEPVPTDVELGPDGWLYVSSLPGGPEDGSLGAQGRVYKVNPKSGKVKMVADGFVSTVDLAVANNGDVYVAELFTGRVLLIKAGKDKAKPFMQFAMPGAVEWTKEALYVIDNALPQGSEKDPKFRGKLLRIEW
jgi:hypothetical protein